MVIVLWCIPVLSSAGQDSNSLGNCLADSSTGKERKALARWVFLAMSTHPEIRALSNATDADRETAHKEMADLVTRLLTVQCLKEVQLVVETEGTEGITQSFKVLGEVAVRELTTAPEVASAMTGYVQYLNREAFQKALLGK